MTRWRLTKMLFAVSAVADAGLERDDIITAIDGQPVAGIQELGDAIDTHAPGDEVTLSVIKGGEGDETTVTVTLTDRPRRTDFSHRIFELPFDGLHSVFPDGFDSFLDGSFRYKDDDGNVHEVAAVAGTVTDISEDSITIETSEGDTRPFDLTDEARVPEGLEPDDDVIVVTVDGDVAAVIAPRRFGGIPLPHFDLEGNGLPFCDEGNESFGSRFEGLRDAICDGDLNVPGFRWPEPCDHDWTGHLPYGACSTPAPTPTHGA